MAYMKICPNCSFPCSAEAFVCKCGTSLVTVSAIQASDSRLETISSTTREESSPGSASITRNVPFAIPSATKRDQPISGGSGLVRLPLALADRYEVKHELPARGNEADLLAAVNRINKDSVMIKLYRTGVEPKEEVLRMIAGLDGRYVIRQLEYGSSEGRFFEVMELAAGGSFADFLRNRSLTDTELLLTVTQISAALAYMHNLTPQMVHRDIKPDNVLVRRSDPLELVLTDFGISSLVDGGSRIAGSIHRTVLYAAPEAIVGDISPAMDWWSLGMIVAEMAGGRHPFVGITEQAIAIHCSNRRPIPLDAVTEPRARLLCQGLLAYDQRQRWGVNEVQRWLNGDTSLRPPVEALPLNENSVDVSELRSSRPYRLGTHECWTARELAVAMCENWGDAIKRVARRADLERWLTHDLNDQNLLNTFLDITEIPAITPEMLLITFLHVLLPGAIPDGTDAAGLEPDILKTCLQASAGVAEGQRRLGQLLISGKELPADRVESERLLRIAFNWFQKVGEQGLADAQCNLGLMYRDGEGVTKNEVEAVKWFQKASDQEYADAQLYLGFCYRDGRGVTKDEVEAFKWFKKAAEQGHAEAQNILNDSYDSDKGVAANEDEAFKRCKKAAEQGHADAQYELGSRYANGQGVKANEDEAFKWYQKAAEHGQAGAQDTLGFHYKHGISVAVDSSEALKWFQKAAEQGYAHAQFNLGEMYNDGDGVAKNETEAFYWYQKAAEQGKAVAQKKLGVMYANGKGVAKNDSEAFKWFKKAAENGDAFAYDLGSCYHLGIGVAVDYSEAVKWFKKAAELEDEDAQFSLGMMYCFGYGVAENEEEAFSWIEKASEQGHELAQYSFCGGMYYGNGNDQGAAKFDEEAFRWHQKAAEQGYASAQYELGCSYRFGKGVEMNEGEAIKCYQIAAEQGYARAQYALADMYNYGEGVAENKVEAVKWYQKAAENGHGNALAQLEKIFS